MINKIAVIGAGTMGRSIAGIFARFDYQVKVYEEFETVRNSVIDNITEELTFLSDENYITEDKVGKAIRNLQVYDNIQDTVSDVDYVIEAVPEDIELKQKVFKELDKYSPNHTVLSTNTSSIPLKNISEVVSEERKSKVMVTHLYNPAFLIPIVELSFFGNMNEEDFQLVYDLYERVEKAPIKVLKDVPGLVANRMLHALAREVFSLIDQEIASPEDVDKALMYGPAFRNATTGMLEVADMGGLDVWYSVQDSLFKDLSSQDSGFKFMKEKVDKNELGLKTGKGFFDYPEGEREKIQEKFRKRLLNQLKVSEKMGGNK